MSCMPWLPEARWFWRSSVPSPATQAPSLVGYSRSFLPNRIPDFASLKIDISSTYSDPMASRTFVWPTTPSENEDRVYLEWFCSSIKRFNCVAERCSSEVFLASVECLELIRLDTANYATALEAESNRGFIQLASEEHGVAPCLMLSLLLNDTFP
ncbi:unnamed protein product [Vicia faba]|uniref:Uncharacterized protein n=1 Tax=Vicia faba TaxID=3906 RepID=A0AAV1A8S6_VICFA|nr:unnamed protein product [Vicia faba]CAI8606053.1 unnamed protein product [Vicia faba]